MELYTDKVKMDCTVVGWRVQHHVKVKCFLGKEESVTVVSNFSPASQRPQWVNQLSRRFLQY